MSGTDGLDKAKLNTARHDLIVRVAQMQEEAGRLGLFKTMHSLHEANRAGGFELAEILENDRKAKLAAKKTASSAATRSREREPGLS